MEITILGKSPSWQDAGGACSGYLVEDQGFRLLLDCGNGVFGKLRARLDYLDVHAVLITHLHADHFLDLIPFAYALTYSPRQGDAPAQPVLHVPAGARDVFRRVVGAWGSEELIEAAFRLREYEPAETLHAGPFTLRLQSVPHYVPTCAVEVTAAGGAGRRFVFAADLAPSDALATFAAGADLLLIEATLPEPEPEPDGRRGHLTAAEAGEHGRRAGVGRLVLTHITDELDAGRALAEAGQAFGGPVEVAREGAVYAL